MDVLHCLKVELFKNALSVNFLTNVPPLMRSKVVILCAQTMVHAGNNSRLEFSDVAHDVFRLIYVSPFEIVS
jgi:hypothetical protein